MRDPRFGVETIDNLEKAVLALSDIEQREAGVILAYSNTGERRMSRMRTHQNMTSRNDKHRITTALTWNDLCNTTVVEGSNSPDGRIGDDILQD